MKPLCRYLNGAEGPQCVCDHACALGFTGDEEADSERAWAYERERAESRDTNSQERS